MEKYGFVYIWYDRKHKRYYLGAHWGTEDDGYICSSSWMKRAYMLRPEDFKKLNGSLNRRILSKIYTNKKDLHEEEYKWLRLIKSEELGKKYYNLHNTCFGGHCSNYKRLFHSEEAKKKMSEAKKGKPGPNKGKKFSKEHCKNLSIAHKNQSPSEETKRKISAFFKDRPRKSHSEETKRKISVSKKGVNNIQNKKCPYCGLECNPGMYSRWHGENCKRKPEETREIFKKFLTELQLHGRMVPIITVDDK